jgi:hypothetical protein
LWMTAFKALWNGKKRVRKIGEKGPVRTKTALTRVGARW